MQTPVILVSRQLPDLLTAALQRLGEVRVCGADADDTLFQGAAAYVALAVDPVSEQLIERFPPELKLIANIGVGTDNIDFPAASARGIHISNTPVVTEDTADLAMALLLAACRRLTSTESLLRAGRWAQSQGELGVRVHGKTLGIVGFGAIGQAVARRASGFNMQVLYHGPHRKESAEAALGATYRDTLRALLEESDIVSLHCALTDETRHILNADTLAQLKPGAIVINTGRGPLIHEEALVESLESGHLGGAGLDVFEFEPEVTPKLLTFGNVTLLPHIGSATGECRQDMALRLVANVRAFLEAGAPLDACT